MRIDDPVLWAIVRGRGHRSRIGLLSGQSTKAVDAALEALVRSKRIYSTDASPDVFHLNPNHPETPGHRQLTKLYEAMELKWLGTGSFRPERGVVSAGTWDRWKAENPDAAPKVDRYDEMLTTKQAQFFVTIRALETTFSPMDVARAQGFTRPGYTKNSLGALEDKGLVKEVSPRPSTWRLTPLGVDKLEEVWNAGIRLRKRETVEVDIEEL